jgi:hypothetical protein
MVFNLFIVGFGVAESSRSLSTPQIKKEEKGKLGDNTKAKYLSSLSPKTHSIMDI